MAGSYRRNRFPLLTGWRRSEVLGLRSQELDIARWTARLEDTKTGLSVRPLSEAACEILRGQGNGKPDALVFPATRSDGTPADFDQPHLAPDRQEKGNRKGVNFRADGGQISVLFDTSRHYKSASWAT